MIFDAEHRKLMQAIEEAPTIPGCQTTDPEIFFPDNDESNGLYNMAKQMCFQCPVQEQCLDYAMKTYQPFGVWGGLTYRERYRLRGGERLVVRKAVPIGKSDSRNKGKVAYVFAVTRNRLDGKRKAA